MDCHASANACTLCSARVSSTSVNDATLAVVVSGFPRRSETFALNELLALDAAGMLGSVFATKPGDPGDPQPDHDRLLRRVEVLPAGSPADQAALVARRLKGSPVTGIHGYFAHTPAEVASLAARRLGVAYGFSVHAKDARKVSPENLVARARSAACVIACNPDVAADVERFGVLAQLIPHGVNIHRFQPRPLPTPEPLRLLAVGRLVEKKGFAVLLAALELLEIPLVLHIIGEGPERDGLQAAIERGGLQERVSLCGPMTHAQLPAEYAAAHVVVVPSVLDRSGDRDGLPNVVLEAMASQRAVVASRIAAIASAVRHGETGLLVPPGDAAALAAALRTVAAQPTLLEHMGRHGRRRVEAEFELRRCTQRLVQRLRAAYA
jgi:glycosyltransferase involved in cell wall biosynthesis